MHSMSQLRYFYLFIVEGRSNFAFLTYFYQWARGLEGDHDSSGGGKPKVPPRVFHNEYCLAGERTTKDIDDRPSKAKTRPARPAMRSCDTVVSGAARTRLRRCHGLVAPANRYDFEMSSFLPAKAPFHIGAYPRCSAIGG